MLCKLRSKIGKAFCGSSKSTKSSNVRKNLYVEKKNCRSVLFVLNANTNDKSYNPEKLSTSNPASSNSFPTPVQRNNISRNPIHFPSSNFERIGKTINSESTPSTSNTYDIS